MIHITHTITAQKGCGLFNIEIGAEATSPYLRILTAE